jgi:hypothetical protein
MDNHQCPNLHVSSERIQAIWLTSHLKVTHPVLAAICFNEERENI